MIQVDLYKPYISVLNRDTHSITVGEEPVILAIFKKAQPLGSSNPVVAINVGLYRAKSI